jgi:hypothetical protein
MNDSALIHNGGDFIANVQFHLSTCSQVLCIHPENSKISQGFKGQTSNSLSVHPHPFPHPIQVKLRLSNITSQ